MACASVTERLVAGDAMTCTGGLREGVAGTCRVYERRENTKEIDQRCVSGAGGKLAELGRGSRDSGQSFV